MFSNQLLRYGFDIVRICDVELDRLDARIGLYDGIQMALAPARDDHFVAAFVQRLGQGAANARSAAGNENSVSSEIHGAPICVIECCEEVEHFTTESCRQT